MPYSDLIRLILLAAIWGSSFVFMRVISPVLGSVVTPTLRLILGGSALVLFFYFTKRPMLWKQNARHYLFVGLGNCALPFFLFSFAAQHIPASYGVILNASTPLFAAIFSALWLNDALSFRKLLGLVLGACGAGLVAKGGGALQDDSFWMAVLACLAAPFLYALTGVYIKKFASHVQSQSMAAGSQMLAGISLLGFVPFFPTQGAFTPKIVLCLLALALMCSSFAFILYFRLIESVGPTRAMTVAFLMPGFGMLWGYLFLDEKITLSMLLGCGLIIIGIALVLVKPGLFSIRSTWVKRTS